MYTNFLFLWEDPWCRWIPVSFLIGFSGSFDGPSSQWSILGHNTNANPDHPKRNTPWINHIQTHFIFQTLPNFSWAPFNIHFYDHSTNTLKKCVNLSFLLFEHKPCTLNSRFLILRKKIGTNNRIRFCSRKFKLPV